MSVADSDTEMVAIIVNGTKKVVMKETPIDYSRACMFAGHPGAVGMSVMYRTPTRNGSLWDGGPSIKPEALLVINAHYTDNA